MSDRHVVHLVLNDEQREQLRHAVAYWADLKRLWREDRGFAYPDSEIGAEQVAGMVYQLTESYPREVP
jgi:hypothetical protein